MELLSKQGSTAHFLQSIVEGLIDLQKVQLDRFSTNHTWFNVVDVIHSVCQIIEFSAKFQ